MDQRFSESTESQSRGAEAVPGLPRMSPQAGRGVAERQIPGDSPLALFRNTWNYLSDPAGHVGKDYARFGSVFRGNMFFERGVFLVGPDAAEVVLTDREQIFSSKLGWRVVLRNFFDGGLMLRDFDNHRAHRRIMQEVFKKEPMRRYGEVLNGLVQCATRDWDRVRPFQLYSTVKELTLSTAAVVFCGLRPDEDVSKLNSAFVEVVRGAGSPIRRAIPLSARWRGLRAREYLRCFFADLIPSRRSGEGQDLLSHMCRARTEEGEVFSDEEIVDHLIFLMMAAHDTTTSALTNLILELGRHPEIQEHLRQESRRLNKPFAQSDDVVELTQLYNAFCEVLRLYPPVRMIPRRTTRECEVLGHVIPGDTTIWISPQFHHRMSAFWTNPARFDPGRFSEERAEHKRHRFQWTPFGGGAHVCLGMPFSRLQMTTVMHQVLLRFRWVVGKDYQQRMAQVPFPRPTKNPPIVFERTEMRAP